MIKTDCPSCQTPLVAPDSYAGKKPLCPVCKAKVPAVAPPSQRKATAARKPVPKAKQLVDELLEDAKNAPPAAAAKAPSRPVKRTKPAKPREEPSPATKQKSVSWGVITAFAVGVLIVLGAGIFAFHKVSTTIHSRERQRVVSGLESALASVEAKHAAAQARMQAGLAAADEEKYAQAREAFVAALGDFRDLKADVASLRERVNTWAREYPKADRFEVARRALADMGDSIDKALDSQALTQGPQLGETLAIYEGKWMSPERKQELYERRMKDLGNVFYEGEWITKQEWYKRQGMVQYKGKWYPEAQAEKLMERDKAIEEAMEVRKKREAEAAKEREKELLARKEKYPADAESWILDDFEGGSKWSAMRWANPCDLTPVKRGDTTMLKVDLNRGAQDKWALNLKLGIDMTSRSRLRMKVINASDRNAQFAIALQTNAFHESRTKVVRQGENNLSFDLDAGTFKTEKSEWKHTARLGGKDYVGQLFLLIYKAQAGQTFYVDNVQATK